MRDFVARGAGFWDCARLFGLFLVYIAVVALFFCHRCYSDKKKLTENKNHASLAEAWQKKEKCIPVRIAQ